MKKARSLSDQLNDLNNVAPDGPESNDEDYDATREVDHDASEDDGEDEARSHAQRNIYIPSTSALRRRADFMDGADADQRRRYEGVKTSRKEMLEQDEGSVSSGDDSSEDEEVDRVSEQSSSDTADSEGEYNEVSSSEKQEQAGKTFTNGSQTATNGRAKIVQFYLPADEADSAKKVNAAQSDAQLLQQLRSRRREDAAKGRDAQKQRASWSKLLGVRIRAQKVVRAGGRIPSKLMKNSRDNLDAADLQHLDSTLESLDDISRHLFILQRQILQSFTKEEGRENTVISASLSALQPMLDRVTVARKRSIDDVSEHDAQIEALLQIDQQIFEPLWRDVLSRWSSRTSASLEAGANRNKFQVSLKAMNQSAEDQIDRGLTGDAFERLSKRTRVWRGNEEEGRLLIDSTTESALQQEDEDTSAKGERELESNDVFDDSDFYSALLRELIDSRGASSEMGGGLDVPDSSLLWAQAAKKAAKKNMNGEIKASKGRKLRYDVIEKVEHFMPPVPRETWSEEQIDRLFRQIKGADHTSVEKDDVDDQIDVSHIGDQREDLGGLRLFG